MEWKNRYYRHSHIPERKFRQLMRYFAMDLSAADVAQLTGLTRKSVNTIFLKVRQRLAKECKSNSDLPESEFQMIADDYLGRARSKNRDNQSVIPVSGSGNDEPDRTRIQEPADSESLNNFARRRLQKFYGVSGDTLYLHLKECEWRYTRRHQDLYVELLKLLSRHPL